MTIAPQPSDFAACRDALLEQGERLKRMLQPEQGTFVEESILQNLRMNRFSVAVIGEIKAGKSTFLNALIGRPDFLPTNPNPWTTVITHLHFAQPDGRANGAEFTFFTHAEWQKITEPVSWRKSIRNTLLQVLDGAPVPEEEKEWERQREKIARRARAKPGEETIQKLLGKKAVLSAVGPGELVDYLADEGQYALITKEADVYFPRPPAPFEGSFSIVDTPGTNDPCRVREKRTFDFLGSADAYVVVIRALAALNQGVVGLLRKIVFGLQKSRLIIFVNSIDCLTNPETEVPLVKRHVEGVLKDLFPEVQIPVVMGCAWWGVLALLQDVSSWIDDFKWKSFRAYVQSQKWFTSEEIQQLKKGAESGSPNGIRKAIGKASGIFEIRKTIQNVLLREKGRALLEKTQDALEVQAEASAAAANRDADHCEQAARKWEEDLQSAQKNLDELRQKTNRQEEQRNELEKVQQKKERVLRNRAYDRLEDFDKALQEVVKEFAAREMQRLLKHNTVIGPDFECSLQQCGSNLQDTFLDKYARLREDLKCQQQEFLQLMQQKLGEIDKGLAENMSMVVPKEIEPTPSLAGVKAMVEIEFDYYYRIVGHFFEGKKGRAQQLYDQIMDSFDDPLQKLTEKVRKEVHQALDKTFEQLRWAVSQGTEQLEARQQRDAQLYEQIERGMNPKQVRERVQQSQQSAEQHRQRAAELDRISKEIDAMALPGN